ncbi:FMN reductase (NADPH) [Bacillus oleivorans]|uniref:FMN reductase (NADPH) n=1 Tax=Bacillus oleivorans TaxID=1448271 RepID=A0A285CQX1_9BACI|nr:oxygen-insensitive NADPH nitroreductase [Bacillus oleivorans]SNX69825.1 FMN reductase (NADPH) [Bacillus oleivorans]
MNQVIETILRHRSVRKFTEQPLSSEQIELIVKSAQAASTSSYIQAYSIIGITDLKKKQALAEVAGNQAYVAENGHFFIFCADLHRHQKIGEWEGSDVLPSIESTEKFMVALIDTALAAQNAVLAAESMGLGICYIGGIRNDLEKVASFLKTPKHVIPLFGIAVGYPAKETSQKPRLPLNHVYHENEYEQDESAFKAGIDQYNQSVQDYYNKRTNGKRSDTWSSQMGTMLEKKSRMYMKEFIEKKGLNLR